MLVTNNAGCCTTYVNGNLGTVNTSTGWSTTYNCGRCCKTYTCTCRLTYCSSCYRYFCSGCYYKHNHCCCNHWVVNPNVTWVNPTIIPNKLDWNPVDYE